MLQKFVYITGALDFLVGAGTFFGAMNFAANAFNEAGDLHHPLFFGLFVAMMTLGMFLMMAAACLMWASKDMRNRHPVIFWQGLVRLTAVCSVLYAVPAGLSESWEYSLVAFDGVIGLTYVIGMMKVTGLSVPDLLLCKSPAAVPA